MRRVRRPLLALIVLVLAVAVGYAVDALRSADSSPHRSPGPSAPASTIGSLPAIAFRFTVQWPHGRASDSASPPRDLPTGQTGQRALSAAAR